MEKINEKKTRDSNIELLRIILMLMIVLGHLIFHVCNFPKLYDKSYQSQSEVKDFLFFFFYSFVIIAVDCFIFISGYYEIKFKTKSLINFYIQAIFYSLSIFFICRVVLNSQIEVKSSFLINFFPLNSQIWWFLSLYVTLVVLSPIINKGVDLLTKYQHLGLIFILICLTNIGPGHDLYNFILIYIIGRFCKIYITHIPKANLYYVGLFCLTFSFAYISYLLKLRPLIVVFYTYGFPLTILTAIMFFYSFKNISIKSNIINKISPLVFGVYLIHDHVEIRNLIRIRVLSLLNYVTNPFVFMLILTILAILIFAVCVSIEKVRQNICQPVVDRLDKYTNLLWTRTKIYIETKTVK